jgi:ribonuclease P protein component
MVDPGRERDDQRRVASVSEAGRASVPSRFGADRRLRRHAEFVRAQSDRAARRIGTPHFTLLVAAQETPVAVRLGLVVSRRVGGAVQRNRVKRLCRECFRRWPGLLPNGVDLIVIAREGAPELDLTTVRAEWSSVTRLLAKRAAEALARGPRRHHLARTPARPPPSSGPDE